MLLLKRSVSKKLIKMEEDKENEIEERQEESKEKREKEEKIIREKPKHHDFHVKPASKDNQLLETVRGNPWIISTIVMGVVVLVLLFSNFGGITGNVSKNTAGETILNFAKSQVGDDVSLVGVELVDDLYEVTVLYNGNEIPLYLTKDGKNLVQGVIPVSQLTSSSGSNQAEEIPKTDKPKVDLYVMSFCPYGNRGENTMVPVYNLLKDKIDFNVHYIVNVNEGAVSSLHGQPEVDENEREVCVLEDYGLGAWWKFVIYVNNNCGSDGSCWKAAASQSGVDDAKLTKCVQEKGLNLMKESETASNNAGASGSPTLIINGVQSSAVYQYGDTNAYKDAICSAFNTAPSECSTQLESVADSGATGSC